jgi:hydroxymethylbilane synthase
MKITIGSRSSKLAKWQADQFMERLAAQGHEVEWKGIQTKGDLDQFTPLDAFGERGVFTKALDVALLNGDIDVAVHSLKDCPASLPDGIHFAAVLPRDFSEDVLVQQAGFSVDNRNTIATSSSRRKAQWLAKFPNSHIVDVRGNVDTRLQKFQQNGWDGMILSRAGLERLGAMPPYFQILDWMVPAPTQGMIAAYTASSNEAVNLVLKKLEDPKTRFVADLERSFMRIVEMKCNAPVAAHAAFLDENSILFRAEVYAADGRNIFKNSLALKKTTAAGEVEKLAELARSLV